MYDIRHRIGVTAPIEQVYERVATIDGLAAWWTSDTTGESKVGGVITFRFGDEPGRSMDMEVVELTPPGQVVWRCTQGPDEWLDTTFTFDLRPDGDETVVLFTQAGWREPVEFMHHCTTKWGSYLLSLKHGVEDGKGAPWPNDERVSSWD